MLQPFYRHPLLIAYLVLSLLHLIGEQIAAEMLILITKPLLLPLLALWFWQQTKEHVGAVRTFLILGLLFSCGGDTLLMFVEHGPKQENFFLLGLGSFLIAQLCYVVAFVKYPRLGEGLVAKFPFLVLLFLGYWYWVLDSLWGGIPAPMRLPVAIYALAIVAMALMALNLSGRIASNFFWGLFGGVALFVLSDTLIAFNKFGDPVPYARLSIMITYLAAQLLIAWNGARMLLMPTKENAD